MSQLCLAYNLTVVLLKRSELATRDFVTLPAGDHCRRLGLREIANDEIFRAHAFEDTCAKDGIEHGTTKPRHSRTNDQLKRMNRTIKDATIKGYY